MSFRISSSISSGGLESELDFANNVGADCVFTWVDDDQANVAHITDLKKRVEDKGLKLYNVGSMTVGKSAAIHLALPERDEMIEKFKSFIKTLGAAGIGATTFTWEPDKVWSTGREMIRGTDVRSVRRSELEDKPFTHGRAYALDELWENFAYFMKELVPVLEGEGVRLALHPNDPPVDYPIAGVPCLITSGARYQQAFDIADSSALGMEFCTGCWLEGGPSFGDIQEGLRRFIRDDRVLIIHFRNVTAPIPDFDETFLDEGYGDMDALMKIIVEEGYTGTVTPDHVPNFSGNDRSKLGFAYAFGALQTLKRRYVR